jgi:hypothetical protein
MKLTVAALAALLFTTPVLATPSPQEDPELFDHEVLVTLIEKLGTPVHFGHAQCKANPQLYGRYMIDGSALIACPLGDRDERLGTVRHEAWHFYQDLVDCNIKDTVGLKTSLAKGVVPPLGDNSWAKYYSQEQMQSETEARWVELNYNAYTITTMIAAKAQACGFKF